MVAIALGILFAFLVGAAFFSMAYIAYEEIEKHLPEMPDGLGEMVPADFEEGMVPADFSTGGVPDEQALYVVEDSGLIFRFESAGDGLYKPVVVGSVDALPDDDGGEDAG